MYQVTIQNTELSLQGDLSDSIPLGEVQGHKQAKTLTCIHEMYES